MTINQHLFEMEAYGKEWMDTMKSHSKDELIDYLKTVYKELHNLKKDKYFRKK